MYIIFLFKIGIIIERNNEQNRTNTRCIKYKHKKKENLIIKYIFFNLDI